MSSTILILHSTLQPGAGPDEQDTLDAVRDVTAALESEGFIAAAAGFVPDLDAVRATVAAHRPACVFNLVESVEGRSDLVHLAPAFLDAIGVPYTGCTAETLLLTGDKIAAKRIMAAAGLPTAPWWEDPAAVPEGRRAIVKHRIEDASFGLDAGAVVTGPRAAAQRAAAMRAGKGPGWFAEAFLPGREFNVSVIETAAGPRALPVPEMRFDGLPEDVPPILGYAAKWAEASAEYEGTRRRFVAGEDALCASLQDLALRAWALFGATGAIRVDLRLDPGGVPHVLEVNANPGIGPEGGLQAACAETGITYRAMVRGLVDAAFARAERQR